MSILSLKVYDVLEDIFKPNPHRRVFEEHYVKFKGQKLFFDFFVKELNCFFECQGRQHYKFVKHFHGTVASFKAQKHRDNLKIEYVQTTGMYLVRIYDYEEVTRKLVLSKIDKVFDSEYNFCD